MWPADTEFRHGALRPLQCYREGWQLIRDDYWLFLGIGFLGTLIGYTIPFGILLGPIWCGFAICYLRRMAGERPSLADLFDGFRYFAPSAGPSILLVTLVMVAYVVIWFGYFAATMGVLFAEMGAGNGLGPAFVAAFGGLTVLYTVGVVGAWVVLTSPFIFLFGLIVERRMSGFAALWTSVRAIFANFWGILGLVAIELFLSTTGIFLGCFGWYFVVPVILAAEVVAYRQVFPRLRVAEDEWDEAEPDLPAVARAAENLPSTGIRGDGPRAAPPSTGITSGPPE